MAKDEQWFILYTNTDVDAAVPSLSHDQLALSVQLTNERGEQMARYTRNNVGKTIIVSLDGKVLHKAVIRGEFGRRFMMTLGEPFSAQEAKLMAILLVNGALPGDARIVSSDIKE